ncbi:MAG: NAD-dependent epimerase/dehydratase family protein [Candidatus Wallbacteria bacterium]|nr:NAD-dependent epimerase/dehydratase family protein [Candidatus Wallbacteria bacterium]
MRKTAMVFGGSGFLGSYVCDELGDKGYRTVSADLKDSPWRRSDQEFCRCNILDVREIEELFQRFPADFVFNFAAMADLEEGMFQPVQTMETNVLGNLKILECCKKRSIERFVYASSAYAFSDKGSFYGISKYTSEKIVEEYFQRFGLKFTIIRYGSLYGERADERNYIYKMLSSALATGRLECRGDGEEVREYIHAHDAARLTAGILEDDRFVNEHIILTGTERFKRMELLTMVREILGNRPVIEKTSDEYAGHYKMTPYSYHPTVAKKLVANPYIDIGQGLVECIRHICEQNAQAGTDG